MKHPLSALALALLPLACGAPTEASNRHRIVEDLGVVEARVLERSRERLQLMRERRWESVYEYFHPEVRRSLTLEEFLREKQAHSYGEAVVTVHAGSPHFAYAKVAVEWAPSWSIRRVVVSFGQDRSGRSTRRTTDPRVVNGDRWERIEFVETWDLYLGQWYLDWPPLRPALWRERHPEVEWIAGRGR